MGAVDLRILPLDVAVERAERAVVARGTQNILFGEQRRKQVRSCSPYGCRSGQDEVA
jgi:hypothetical protein